MNRSDELRHRDPSFKKYTKKYYTHGTKVFVREEASKYIITYVRIYNISNSGRINNISTFVRICCISTYVKIYFISNVRKCSLSQLNKKQVTGPVRRLWS